jgi:TRAP-type mannitol/chloroaromatic compound transport system permease small subunit
MDVFYSRFSRRTRLMCDTGTFIVFLAFAALLAWKTLDMAWASVSINERSWGAFRAPIYPKKIVLALGCCLLLLQGIAQVVRDVRALFGKHSSEPS